MDERNPAHEALAKNFKTAYYKDLDSTPLPTIEFSRGLLSEDTLKVTVITSVALNVTIAQNLLPVSNTYSASLTPPNWATTSLHIKNSEKNPHQIERFLIDHGINAAQFYEEACIEFPEKKLQEFKEADCLAKYLQKTYSLVHFPSVKLTNENSLRVIFSTKEKDIHIAAFKNTSKQLITKERKNKVFIRNDKDNSFRIKKFIEANYTNAEQLYKEAGHVLPVEQISHSPALPTPIIEEKNRLLGVAEKIKQKYNLSHTPLVTLPGSSPLRITLHKNEEHPQNIMENIAQYFPSNPEGSIDIQYFSSKPEGSIDIQYFSSKPEGSIHVAKTALINIIISNDDESPNRINNFFKDLDIDTKKEDVLVVAPAAPTVRKLPITPQKVAANLGNSLGTLLQTPIEQIPCQINTPPQEVLWTVRRENDFIIIDHANYTPHNLTHHVRLKSNPICGSLAKKIKCSLLSESDAPPSVRLMANDVLTIEFLPGSNLNLDKIDLWKTKYLLESCQSTTGSLLYCIQNQGEKHNQIWDFTTSYGEDFPALLKETIYGKEYFSNAMTNGEPEEEKSSDSENGCRQM